MSGSEDQVEIEDFGRSELDASKRITVTKALEEAGVTNIESGESGKTYVKNARLEFDITGAGGADLIPAVVLEEDEVDERTGSIVRKIELAGVNPNTKSTSYSFRVTMPDEVLDRLGIDPVDPKGEPLIVYGGDGLIAFERVSPQSLPNTQDSLLDLLGVVSARDFKAVEIDGLPPEEVAADHDVPVESVSSNVRRAIEEIAALKQEGYQIDYEIPEQVDGEYLIGPHDSQPNQSDTESQQ